MKEQGKNMRKKEWLLWTDPSFHSPSHCAAWEQEKIEELGTKLELEKAGEERYHFNVSLCFSPPECI